MVPGGSNYNVYAYYSYMTYASGTSNSTTTMKYYKVIPNAAPGTAQNFTGTWTVY
jgi:hypothetical protein